MYKRQELYLRGKYYWNKRTPESLNQAVDYFTQAIVRDPGYAKAYSGLADCYNLLREYAAMPASEAWPRAIAAAKKAVELDDSSAEAHSSLAFVLFYGALDIRNGEREFQRAIQLNPDYEKAHHWYATSLMVQGRYREALAEIERARELDPASTSTLADKGYILFYGGQPDQAIALLKQVEAAEPASQSAHIYLATIYLSQNDSPNYLLESRKAAELSQNAPALKIWEAARKGFAAGGTHGMLESICLLYTSARDARDDASRQLHLPDEAITAVGNVQVTLAVQRHIRRERERRQGGLHSIALVTGLPVTGDSRNNALHRNLANPEVLLIGHVDVARGIHAEPPRTKEQGGGGWPSVAGKARSCEVARKGSDVTAGIHFDDDVSAGNVQIARRIDGYASHATAHGRNRGDHAGRRHLAPVSYTHLDEMCIRDRPRHCHWHPPRFQCPGRFRCLLRRRPIRPPLSLIHICSWNKWTYGKSPRKARSTVHTARTYTAAPAANT